MWGRIRTIVVGVGGLGEDGGVEAAGESALVSAVRLARAVGAERVPPPGI